jgi:hypothetical protein
MTMKSRREMLESIDLKLAQIESELRDEWPIVPRDKLIASHHFLTRLLVLLEKNPNLNLDEGTQQEADEFSQEAHPVGLAAVTTMQPNIAVFNWHIFKHVLSFNTPIGDFIDAARARINAEKKAVAVKEMKYVRDQTAICFYSGLYNLFGKVNEPPANDDVRPLLGEIDKFKRYDAC